MLAAAISAAVAAPAQPDWVLRSNDIAHQVQLINGKYYPEFASDNGEEQYDLAVEDMGPQRFERRQADMDTLLAKLRAIRAAEADGKVGQDVDILIDSVSRDIDTSRLHHQQLLEFIDPAATAYEGLNALLDSRNKPERQVRAIERLKRYAGLTAGYTPIAELARARMAEELQRPGLTGPYVEGFKETLDNTDFYLNGVADLFRKAKLTGWEPALDTLAKQMHAYDAWAQENIMPRTRSEARQPAEIYATSLKNVGVDLSPDELIERAGFDFQEVRDEMQVLARQIAAKRHLPSSDYRDVIRFLKKDQLPPMAVLQRYWMRLHDIEAIIRRENLLTLPDRKAQIRMATAAEAAAIPSPYFQPARLIGNTGEQGIFIISTYNPHAKSGEKMDDDSYDAATWTLAAHEARPGHELQYASMVEHGVSIARAIYADNSANVEGWALYCEAMILPYMPPEAQLISLQSRMLRYARAFLDPMVNLGRMTPAEAKRFLMNEVVFSEPASQQEIDRYAFNDPGQATAYYYGYLQLRTLRTQAEIALGPKFSLKAFNDFVLAQGLLPPRQLKRALLDDFIPQQQDKTVQITR